MRPDCRRRVAPTPSAALGPRLERCSHAPRVMARQVFASCVVPASTAPGVQVSGVTRGCTRAVLQVKADT